MLRKKNPYVVTIEENQLQATQKKDLQLIYKAIAKWTFINRADFKRLLEKNGEIDFQFETEKKSGLKI